AMPDGRIAVVPGQQHARPGFPGSSSGVPDQLMLTGQAPIVYGTEYLPERLFVRPSIGRYEMRAEILCEQHLLDERPFVALPDVVVHVGEGIERPCSGCVEQVCRGARHE